MLPMIENAMRPGSGTFQPAQTPMEVRFNGDKTAANAPIECCPKVAALLDGAGSDAQFVSGD